MIHFLIDFGTSESYLQTDLETGCLCLSTDPALTPPHHFTIIKHSAWHEEPSADFRLPPVLPLAPAETCACRQAALSKVMAPVTGHPT